VIGVIVAFQHLGEGSEASMGLVMGGIAEALIATGVGIFVAIPAVIGFNTAQARVNLLEGEIHSLGRLLAARLRTEPVPVASSTLPVTRTEAGAAQPGDALAAGVR
jgi:biopolymer transport protein ExbB/biopolymer transport protein TolQ